MRAVAVGERAAFDDVVGELVVVGVRGKLHRRQGGAEMEHGRELDAQLPGRMDADAQLERLAHARGLQSRPDAAPERRVEQDDVDGMIADVGRQLLEVRHDGVGRDRQVHELPDAAQAVHAPGWILVVVVPEVGYRAPHADRVADAVGSVGIDPEVVIRECRAKGPEAFELVVRRKDPGLELVAAETPAILQLSSVGHELVDRPDFALAGLLVGVAKEQVARERDFIPHLSAEQVVNRHLENLAGDVEAGELQGGVDLGAVVVESGRGVQDLEPEGRGVEDVVAEKLGFEGFDRELGALASAAHFSEAHEPALRLHLDDGSNEAAPVGAGGVT